MFYRFPQKLKGFVLSLERPNLRLQLSTAVFLIWFSVSLMILYPRAISSFNLYFMYGSFILYGISIFAFDVFKNKNIYTVLHHVSILVCLHAFFWYILIANHFDTVDIIYLGLSATFGVFLTPYRQFPHVIILGFLIGFFLVYMEKGTPELHFSWQKVIIFFNVLLIVFVVWYHIYGNHVSHLDKVEKALKEQAISIGHELTSILTTTRLKSQYLLANEGKIDPLQRVNHLNSLVHSTTTGINLLEITKNTFREYLPHAQTKIIDTLPAIVQALEEYSLAANQKQLIKIEGDTFPIFFDEYLFKIVIYNLLRNALYFIEKAQKGSIKITFFSNHKGNYISFYDTAYGIENEYIEKVFDRFFSRRKNGTGMGLYFCKEVMNHFGGDIVCKSEFGKYTEFLLCFPPIIRG